jgi:3-methylcrotonyl-CoA carboxylase alpha subunit
MFDKILVANRGEIACRVMKTARKLGVKTVAVYSEADRSALHVKMADEAHCIGPPPSSESYLLQDKIIAVAKSTGSQGIHPGYGFLSENKNFANLCSSSGFEFIGPPASAIEKMGIKRLSKEIMSSSGVPIVPGYFGDDQSDDRLRAEAEKLGYPVLLKADLGGGGKGMRIIHDPKDFDSLLAECRSESMKSFSDDKVMVEKFVSKPRHVEVQVFADKHGNTVHLFERDCSVQRRHQKIIEEAPAPDLRPEVREEILSAAVKAAQAVGYVGAGTVEFILDADQKFYFMEMNTRLQVEHPITEMVTGVDLVDWQLKVAMGNPLPVSQADITCSGHAFEARVYAENPEQNFSPSPGHLTYLHPPVATDTVRIDTGVTQGDDVSPYYDPMIAKLVVWSEDRTSALKKLTDSLHNYQIAGLTTNVEFLGRLASHPSFRGEDVHTGFIDQHRQDLFPPKPSLTAQQLAQACSALLAWETYQFSRKPCFSNDIHSPFQSSTGSRINTQNRRLIHLNCNDQELTMDVLNNGDGNFVLCSVRSVKEGNEQVVNVHFSSDLVEEDNTLSLKCLIGDSFSTSNVAVIGRTIYIFSEDMNYQVVLPTPEYYTTSKEASGGGLRSPGYSSRVSKVTVKPGDSVSKGDVLMTVEGMKMETTILAPRDGVVKEVLYASGDTVPANSRLLYFESEE